jgi:hypothetical protein
MGTELVSSWLSLCDTVKLIGAVRKKDYDTEAGHSSLLLKEDKQHLLPENQWNT